VRELAPGRGVASTPSPAKQENVRWVRGLNGAIAPDLHASYPDFKQELVKRQSKKNVKEHAKTRFTIQHHALNQSFRVSTEESTSQTSQDVFACRVTLESAAKRVLKVCMTDFL